MQRTSIGRILLSIAAAAILFILLVSVLTIDAPYMTGARDALTQFAIVLKLPGGAVGSLLGILLPLVISILIAIAQIPPRRHARTGIERASAIIRHLDTDRQARLTTTRDQLDSLFRTESPTLLLVRERRAISSWVNSALEHDVIPLVVESKHAWTLGDIRTAWADTFSRSDSPATGTVRKLLIYQMSKKPSLRLIKTFEEWQRDDATHAVLIAQLVAGVAPSKSPLRSPSRREIVRKATKAAVPLLTLAALWTTLLNVLAQVSTPGSQPAKQQDIQTVLVQLLKMIPMWVPATLAGLVLILLAILDTLAITTESFPRASRRVRTRLLGRLPDSRNLATLVAATIALLWAVHKWAPPWVDGIRLILLLVFALALIASLSPLSFRLPNEQTLTTIVPIVILGAYSGFGWEIAALSAAIHHLVARKTGELTRATLATIWVQVCLLSFSLETLTSAFTMASLVSGYQGLWGVGRPSQEGRVSITFAVVAVVLGGITQASGDSFRGSLSDWDALLVIASILLLASGVASTLLLRDRGLVPMVLSTVFLMVGAPLLIDRGYDEGSWRLAGLVIGLGSCYAWATRRSTGAKLRSILVGTFGVVTLIASLHAYFDGMVFGSHPFTHSVFRVDAIFIDLAIGLVGALACWISTRGQVMALLSLCVVVSLHLMSFSVTSVDKSVWKPWIYEPVLQALTSFLCALVALAIAATVVLRRYGRSPIDWLSLLASMIVFQWGGIGLVLAVTLIALGGPSTAAYRTIRRPRRSDWLLCCGLAIGVWLMSLVESNPIYGLASVLASLPLLTLILFFHPVVEGAPPSLALTRTNQVLRVIRRTKWGLLVVAALLATAAVCASVLAQTWTSAIGEADLSALWAGSGFCILLSVVVWLVDRGLGWGARLRSPRGSSEINV
ncbi:MAG: hypothetical protein WBO35_04065 [Candidatus Saccharimonadales bacterium]